jgi:uncharacterized OB-fold protein
LVEYSFKQHKLIGFFDAGDEFWEGLEDGVFRLSRCAGCQRWLWEPSNGSPPYRCADCGSWDQEWVAVEPVGTVYAWTRANQPFDGVLERRNEVPYVTIEAEIPAAGGARVTGLLDGDLSRLRVGAPVRGRIVPPSVESKGYATVRWSIVGAE